MRMNPSGTDKVIFAGGIAALAALFFLAAPHMQKLATNTELLAAAGAARPTPSVQVMPDNNKRVSLNAIYSDETIKESKTCWQEGEIERYFGSQANYQKKLKEQAACVSGYMQATVLDGKIANTKRSIEIISSLLAMLQKTKAMADKQTSINGFAFIGIAGGVEIATKLESAAGIAVKCRMLEDILLEKEIAVGKRDLILFTPIFVRNYAETRTAVARVMKENKALAESIAAKLEEDGELGVWFTLNNIVWPVLGMKEKVAEIMIPIVPELLASDIQSGVLKPKDMIVIRMDLEKDADGKFIVADNIIPEGIQKALNKIGITGPFYMADMSMGGVSQKVSLPEGYILKDFKKEVNKKIEKLTKDAENYEAMLKYLKNQLAALEKRNYGCTAAP